ncbi:gamma-glutamyltranspeptidase [Polyplosphaeria fusca]|uniref:Glutathione hydrolase n=1 Tax=Polyplosphaeria fusca TaxID=682080 RepID=A0A9P4RAD6_9PLEO|nr:gamma-glutamyltranspeptidase [Polyplosphaeria fusca]
MRFATVAHAPPSFPFHNPPSHHYNDEGTKGALSSENKLCSRVGIDIMQEGGNAADAIVGTVFCIGVVSMYHSGIGGGGFALVRRSNGSYDMVDFRETAPAAAFEDMFRDNINASLHGGLSSATPGELRGLEYLSKTYGRLPWARLVQPAIDIARNGFTVSYDLARNMDLPDTEFMTSDSAWSQDFAPNGTRLGFGDMMIRHRYANTLEAIAKHGPAYFYTGELAKATINAVTARNGTMTLNDLAAYNVKIRAPLSITYRDYKITACEAPASGAVTLSAMKLLEGYADIGARHARELSVHRVIEALKFGFGMRPNLGDSYFLTGMREYQNEMISSNVAAINRGKISDLHTLNVSDYDPEGLEIPHDSGTSHIVAADANGLVISLTTTINNPWGSYIMVPETGVVMNNQMNDFSVPDTSNGFGYIPAPANFIRPRKTPLSSMSPVIVDHLLNSTFYFAAGSAGGSRIISAVLQILWGTLDQGLDVHTVLAQPRFHDQLIPPETLFEYGYDNDTTAFIANRWHNITWVAPGYTEAEAIRKLPNGSFEASADPRLADGSGLTF